MWGRTVKTRLFAMEREVKIVYVKKGEKDRILNHKDEHHSSQIRI